MALTGESSHHLSSFKLPKTDTQVSKRNFPGYDEKEYYTIADMQADGQSGTTDTDSFTDSDQSEKGYAAIYKKHGPFGREFHTQSPHTKEN